MPPAPFVFEVPQSRKFSVGKDTIGATLEYICYGTMKDEIAKAEIAKQTPLKYPTEEGLVRDTIETQTFGGLLFYAVITYIPDGSPLYPEVGIPGPVVAGPVPASPGLNTPLGPDFAFDLTAQTEHITQSLKTIHKIGRDGMPVPDNKRAIGITKDGEVQGCDRFKPYLEWSTTKTFKYITMAYIDKLSELVGTTNKAVFYSHDIGTTIFLGASGNTKDLFHCVVTFKFAKQLNKEGINICDGLSVPSKKGWEYLWIAYKDVDDANKLTQQPSAAYVEQIYEEGDYVKMGIG